MQDTQVVNIEVQFSARYDTQRDEHTAAIALGLAARLRILVRLPGKGTYRRAASREAFLCSGFSARLFCSTSMDAFPMGRTLVLFTDLLFLRATTVSRSWTSNSSQMLLCTSRRINFAHILLCSTWQLALGPLYM